MTVYELLQLFADPEGQNIIVWSFDEEKPIYNGLLEDMPENIQEAEISSIDNITFNSESVTVNI